MDGTLKREKKIIAGFFILFILSSLGTIQIDSIHGEKNFLIAMNDINNFHLDIGYVIPNISHFISNESFQIIFPKMTIPSIVKRGEKIAILYTIQPPSQEITFQITTAYDQLPETFNLTILDREIVDTNNNLMGCIVEIPPEAPPELYNLTLIAKDRDIYYTSPKSVCIKEKIDGNFTFVHITDFHIGDPRGIKENFWQTIGWKAAKRCIEEVNLLHPDFVIITGDLVYGQIYPGEYKREYRKCWEILQKFDVPIYLCPGNHDGYIQIREDGFTYWEKYFGPLYYSFDYGDAHFVAINSYDWQKQLRRAFLFLPVGWGGCIQEKQIQWIDMDLNKYNTSSIKVLAMHHNPLWDTKEESLLRIGYIGRNEILSIIQKQNVNAILSGHVHYDNITIVNNTLFITTTTCASSPNTPDAYWGYRLIKVRNYSIESYNYKEPKYSIPSYHLSLRDIDDYTKSISNDLDIGVNVEVTFLVEKGNYSIEHGNIIMVRNKGNLMEIYASATIPSHSEITVRILPS